MQQRTKVVGDSWEVFTKRVLVEKHIIGIMYENLLPPYADAHVYNNILAETFFKQNYLQEHTVEGDR